MDYHKTDKSFVALSIVKCNWMYLNVTTYNKSFNLLVCLLPGYSRSVKFCWLRWFCFWLFDIVVRKYCLQLNLILKKWKKNFLFTSTLAAIKKHPSHLIILLACVCSTAAWGSSQRRSLCTWCWFWQWLPYSSYGLHGNTFSLKNCRVMLYFFPNILHFT